MKSKDRLAPFVNDALFRGLPEEDQTFLKRKADEYGLSFQDIRQLLVTAADLRMWSAGSLRTLWDDSAAGKAKGRDRKQKILTALAQLHAYYANTPRQYRVDIEPPAVKAPRRIVIGDSDTILGDCPVFGERTRCCGLKTMDAVVNCGFGCTYCTIQSFYDDGRVYFHENLGERLANLDLDPGQVYHIGTGQSSDSLMWGNHNGLLDDLCHFAHENPNVILEMKSKSANTAYFRDVKPPANMLFTWSLNTDAVIRGEEHGTAALSERIGAAERMAAAGALVGFHFHPMVYYRGWREEYHAVAEQLIARFDPVQVAMVSIGTLTFIKPVLRKIRERSQNTAILRMPLVDAAGKFSYPLPIKEEMFRAQYAALRPWHGKVFFYLCMEDPVLWKPVFGHEYADNAAFETAMKTAYMEKIRNWE